MKTYEIYATDCNGWDDGCPDFRTIFFGALLPGEQYLHPIEGGHIQAGSLMVVGFRAASARLAKLRVSGDWIDPTTSQEIRPSYAMRSIS